MKLLERKIINENVQAERKNQIDNGIVLAKKVDKLRHELLDLEKQRTDFIAGSQETLYKALGDLKSQKGNLEAEIKEAIKQLAKLREPLDEEWRLVVRLKGEIVQLEKDTVIYFQSLIKERAELATEKAQIDMIKAKTMEDSSKAIETLQKAILERTEAKKDRSIVQSLKEVKEAELYVKELSLESREKKLKEGQDTLIKEKLELNKEKKLLAIKKQRIK